MHIMWNNGHYEALSHVPDPEFTRVGRQQKVHMPQVHRPGQERAPPSVAGPAPRVAASPPRSAQTLLPRLVPPPPKVTRETMLANKAREAAHTEAAKAVGADELAERNRAAKAYRVVAKAQRIAEQEAERAEAVAAMERNRAARNPPPMPQATHLFATRNPPSVASTSSPIAASRACTPRASPSVSDASAPAGKRARASRSLMAVVGALDVSVPPIMQPLVAPPQANPPAPAVIADQNANELPASEDAAENATWRKTTTPEVDALQLVPRVPYPANYHNIPSTDMELDLFLRRLHRGGASRFILGEYNNIDSWI